MGLGGIGTAFPHPIWIWYPMISASGEKNEVRTKQLLTPISTPMQDWKLLPASSCVKHHTITVARALFSYIHVLEPHVVEVSGCYVRTYAHTYVHGWRHTALLESY